MGWQLDISMTTLEALGVKTLAIKQFECDRAPKNILTRLPQLETFITEGREDIPRLPSVKNLHFRMLPSAPGKQLEHAIDACHSLSTLSVMATDAYPPVHLEYLDQPRLHATLESIHIDLRYAYGSMSLSFMPILNHFIKLRKLFVVATSIYGKEDGWYKIESSRSLYKSLPPSIVSVTVMEYEPTPPDRLLTDLIDIASSKSAKFPNLKEIRSNSKEILEGRIVAVLGKVDIALLHEDWPINGTFCSQQSSPYDEPCCSMTAMPLPGELSDDDL
jgi:hypothetical protein